MRVETSFPDQFGVKKRLLDVDVAKGLAIFLVVFGHIVARDVPPGAEWYLLLKRMIYQFHMPFFLFLSGFVMFYTFRPLTSVRDYRTYVAGKAQRLLPGFFFFAVLIVSGKLVAQQVVVVDNAPTTFWRDLLQIVVDPLDSSAASLWYIYVLFEFYVIFALLIPFFGRHIYLLLLVGLGMYVIPMPSYFALNRVFEFFFVFALGGVVVARYERYTALLDRYWPVFLVLFLLSFTLVFRYGIAHLLPNFVIGVLSIPALHGLARRRPLLNSGVLLTLGRHTYAIYLMNTIAIGVTKGMLLLFLPWNSATFLLMAPILLITGLWLPILAKEYVFARHQRLYAIVK